MVKGEGDFIIYHTAWLEAGGYFDLSAGVCVKHKFVIDGIEDNGRCP